MDTQDNNGVYANSIDTACLGCVFCVGSIVDNEQEATPPHFVQTNLGCEANVLQRLQDNGQEIQDAEDANGNEFHMIPGKLCPFYRPQSWRKQDEDIKNEVGRARAELTIKCDTLVYFDNTNSMNELMLTINSMHKWEIKPARIIVINNSDIRPSQLIASVNQSTIPWHIETVMEQCGWGRAMHIGMKKTKTMFVAFFCAGQEPPAHFLSYIDSLLYDKLERFIVIKPYDEKGNGLVVLRNFYKQAGGNNEKNIVDKAIDISEVQECPYLVRGPHE